MLDLFEEEFPHLTSATPRFDMNHAGPSYKVKRLMDEVWNLLPIEHEPAVKEIPMDYRVQTSANARAAQVEAVAIVDGNASPTTVLNATSTVTAYEVERARKSVQLFLLLRSFRLKLSHQRDTLFYHSGPTVVPPPNNTSPALQPVQNQLFHVSRIKVGQELLTAHHPDAILCTLHVPAESPLASGLPASAKRKIHLFFVMDPHDVMLVELQQKKPGIATVKMLQSIRHQEAYLNRNNACLLHLVFRNPTRPHPCARRLTFAHDSCFKPLWCLSLLFLDALQCAKAWKHLDARRLTLRTEMVTRVVKELEMKDVDQSVIERAAVGCTTVAAYPSVEADVHCESPNFGIPNTLPAMIQSTLTPSPAPTPAPASTSASAAPAPASTSSPAPSPTSSPTALAPSTASSPSTAPAVPLPVAEAVKKDDEQAMEEPEIEPAPTPTPNTVPSADEEQARTNGDKPQNGDKAEPDQSPKPEEPAADQPAA